MTDSLFVLEDQGWNAGVLHHQGRALLIGCHEGCTPEVLASLGIHEVAGILLTRPDRDQLTGARFWLDQGASLYCSARAADILAHAGDRWSDPAFRWRRFTTLLPDLTMPCANTTASSIMVPGQTITFCGLTILAVAADGAGPGALAWLVDTGDRRILFCGHAALAGGHLNELWTLQQGFGLIQDYHGILGAAPALRETWRSFSSLAPDGLVPGRGPVETDPPSCLSKLDERLMHLQQSIVQASALNHYFPELYMSWNSTWPRLPAARMQPLPAPVQHLGGTSFLLRSSGGAGFLIDCGDPGLTGILLEQIRSGHLASLDGIFITHFHYDHTEGLTSLLEHFTCPVYASSLTAHTLNHPEAYFLPCQQQEPLPVTAVPDQTTWAWHEFRLTIMEFPGQTLHHGALLVTGASDRILFVGDSLSPTGFDDYCPQNRVLPGPGRGMQRCLDLIRQTRPDCLINQHQERAFSFTGQELDILEQILADRDQLVRDLTGREAGWAWDDASCRVFPFEQKVAPGSVITVSVHLTNHDPDPLPVIAEPVLPEGWLVLDGPAARQGVIPARSEGSVLSDHVPDLSLDWQIRLPEHAQPGPLICLPFRIRDRSSRGLAAMCLIHVLCHS